MTIHFGDSKLQIIIRITHTRICIGIMTTCTSLQLLQQLITNSSDTKAVLRRISTERIPKHGTESIKTTSSPANSELLYFLNKPFPFLCFAIEHKPKRLVVTRVNESESVLLTSVPMSLSLPL